MSNFLRNIINGDRNIINGDRNIINGDRNIIDAYDDEYNFESYNSYNNTNVKNIFLSKKTIRELNVDNFNLYKFHCYSTNFYTLTFNKVKIHNHSYFNHSFVNNGTFTKLTMSKTNLSSTFFIKSSFDEILFNNFCNLSYTKFIKCTLINANFINSTCYSLLFRNSSLTDVLFEFKEEFLISRSRQIDQDERSESITFINTTLTNITFINCNLCHSKFINCTLVNVKFLFTYLTGRNFSFTICSGSDLTGLDLTDINLVYSKFNDNNLTNANFSNTNLIHTKFISTNLTNANFSNASLNFSQFHSANLTNANFSNVDFSNADLNFTVFDSETILTGAIFNGADLSNVDLTGPQFNGVDLSNIIRQRNNIVEEVDAYQIHTEANKITNGDTENFMINKLFPIINNFIPPENTDNFYENLNINITDYVLQKLINYLNTTPDFSDAEKVEEKQYYIRELTYIFNKLKPTREITENNFKKKIIGKCIDFVLSQSNFFINQYIFLFVLETVGAYNNQDNNISCNNGIFERIYMILGNIALLSTADEPNNITYKEIIKLFADKAAKLDISDFANEWSNQYIDSDAGREILEAMVLPNTTQPDIPKRKQHFIDFVKNHPDYNKNDYPDNEIQDYADNNMDYIFTTLQLGGKKKVRTNTKKMRQKKLKFYKRTNKNKRSNKRKETNKNKRSNKRKETNKNKQTIKNKK